MPVAYGHHHNGGIVADCLVFHQRFRKPRPMLHNRVDVQQVTACGHGGHPWRSRGDSRTRLFRRSYTFHGICSILYEYLDRSQAWSEPDGATTAEGGDRIMQSAEFRDSFVMTLRPRWDNLLVSVPYDWFQRSIPQAWKPMARRAMLAGTPHRPSETPANDARLTTFASTWPTPYVDTGYPGSDPSPSKNSASRIAATPSWR